MPQHVRVIKSLNISTCWCVLGTILWGRQAEKALPIAAVCATVNIIKFHILCWRRALLKSLPQCQYHRKTGSSDCEYS